MNDETLKVLSKLAQKEEILAKIIVWLKTKGLFEECFKVVAPDLLVDTLSKPSVEVSKEPLSFNCTLTKFAEQLDVPLWKAMEFGKYFKSKGKNGRSYKICI